MALNQLGELVFVLGQKWLHSKSKTIVHCLCDIVVFSDLVDNTLLLALVFEFCSINLKVFLTQEPPRCRGSLAPIRFAKHETFTANPYSNLVKSIFSFGIVDTHQTKLNYS